MVSLVALTHDFLDDFWQLVPAFEAHLLSADLAEDRLPDAEALASRLAPRHMTLPKDVAVTHPSLDRFDLIILDDITYAHKDQAETGVLFELIARRYEYRSIAIAANQPFSGWDQIFPDKAMTAIAMTAIDRLVHHATILEMNAESFRQRTAASTRGLRTNRQRQPLPTTSAKERTEKRHRQRRQPAASKQAKVVVASGQDG
ncbi:MAG: hypothetical protein ACI92Z_002087 [Paracoccaceae bacterium]